MSLFAVLHSLMRLASGVTHLDLNPLLFHNSLRLSVYSPWGAGGCFLSSSSLHYLSIFPPASSASPGVALLALSSLCLPSLLPRRISLSLLHFITFPPLFSFQAFSPATSPPTICLRFSPPSDVFVRLQAVSSRRFHW